MPRCGKTLVSEEEISFQLEHESLCAGTALESLPAMHGVLQSRPQMFRSPEKAVEWWWAKPGRTSHVIVPCLLRLPDMFHGETSASLVVAEVRDCARGCNRSAAVWLIRCLGYFCLLGVTTGGTEKSQQCHKHFLQYSKFASERAQVRKRGTQLVSCPGRHLTSLRPCCYCLLPLRKFPTRSDTTIFWRCVSENCDIMFCLFNFIGLLGYYCTEKASTRTLCTRFLPDAIPTGRIL